MKKAIATLILCFCPFILLSGQEIQYGLRFKSYEVEKEKRTGLNLTPEKAFAFQDGFRMSFEARFATDWVHPFGSVFRIITEGRDHIDLILSEINNTGRTMVSFISSSHDILFSQPFDSSAIDYGRFIRFEITVDPKNRRIEAAVGDNRFSKESSALDAFRNVSIVFGKSNYPRFQTTDVPAFTLKDLEITGMTGKALYAWPLSRHTADGVYDDIRRQFAACENGEWVLDRHVIWQKQVTIPTRINPQFCYNPDDNEIAVFDRDILHLYNIDTHALEQHPAAHPLVYTSSNSNNLIYNPYTKTYNCYLFELDKGKEVLAYDRVKRDWERDYQTNTPPDYWQHNRLFSPVDGRLYMFFGYGHHRYKNEINRYDFTTRSWEKLSLKGDRIQPRYLSGLGLVDNGSAAIVFGGYGSETGNQNISPQSYYDLFRINLRTLETQKLWEMESPSNDFAVGSTLVPDETGKSFYALAFNTQQFYTNAVLLKFSMERPDYQMVADSIPFHFEDVRSNVDLYLDKQSNQLIAVVASAQRDEGCEVSVYTLAMPPLTADSLYQEEAKASLPPYLLWVGISLLTLAVVLAVAYRLRSRPTSPTAEKTPVKAPAAAEAKKQATVYEHPAQRAVYLFGGFQVFDKKGKDITREFTPMLRQLFLLLLLYTVKNGKGVSSVKLKDLLWYDKSEESAKNNRGVFMNKLRQLFEQTGSLYIKNHDIYWSIELGDDIYSDYLKALSLMKGLSAGIKTSTEAELNALLSIVSKGEMLPNIQTEWLDAFKSDFSNHLIDLLLEVYRESTYDKSPQTSILLADTIFIHDSLNEDALSIKCYNLVQMGKFGLAQKVYMTFTKEYKILFNAEFPQSFEEIIRQ